MTDAAFNDSVQDGATETLKVPPHSLEAEQSVIGGLMIDNEVWYQVAERLHAEDFYRHDHKTIFNALTQLAQENRPFDVVTVRRPLTSVSVRPVPSPKSDGNC